jgi:hypothetical protein
MRSVKHNSTSGRRVTSSNTARCINILFLYAVPFPSVLNCLLFTQHLSSQQNALSYLWLKKALQVTNFDKKVRVCLISVQINFSNGTDGNEKTALLWAGLASDCGQSKLTVAQNSEQFGTIHTCQCNDIISTEDWMMMMMILLFKSYVTVWLPPPIN